MDKERIYNQLLVIRCRQGQEQAWQVLQETWLHVVKSIDTLKCPEYLPKWLYSICHHKILTYYRQRHRQAELHESIANGCEISEAECDRQFENAEAVHWGLGRIKPASREVLTLYFLQDLSIDEIAEVLDIPAGTVKSRLHYARKQLCKTLEDHHYE